MSIVYVPIQQNPVTDKKFFSLLQTIAYTDFIYKKK